MLKPTRSHIQGHRSRGVHFAIRLLLLIVLGCATFISFQAGVWLLAQGTRLIVGGESPSQSIIYWFSLNRVILLLVGVMILLRELLPQRYATFVRTITAVTGKLFILFIGSTAFSGALAFAFSGEIDNFLQIPIVAQMQGWLRQILLVILLVFFIVAIMSGRSKTGVSDNDVNHYQAKIHEDAHRRARGDKVD